MHPRQLLIVAGIAVVAFGAAFGIASAGGGDDAPAAAPKAAAPAPAEEIEVGDATVSAKVRAAAALPALKVPKKKPEESSTSTHDRPSSGRRPSPTTGTTTTPSTGTTTTPSTGTTTTPLDGHRRRPRRPAAAAAAAAAPSSATAAARTEPGRRARRAPLSAAAGAPRRGAAGSGRGTAPRAARRPRSTRPSRSGPCRSRRRPRAIACFLTASAWSMNHFACSPGFFAVAGVLALVPDARAHLEEPDAVRVAVVRGCARRTRRATPSPAAPAGAPPSRRCLASHFASASWPASSPG